MTLREVQGLQRCWQKAPPADVTLRRLERMAAMRLGFEFEEGRGVKTQRKPPTEAEIASLVALAQGRA
jgi:hypothetical protein